MRSKVSCSAVLSTSNGGRTTSARCAALLRVTETSARPLVAAVATSWSGSGRWHAERAFLVSCKAHFSTVSARPSCPRRTSPWAMMRSVCVPAVHALEADLCWRRIGRPRTRQPTRTLSTSSWPSPGAPRASLRTRASSTQRCLSWTQARALTTVQHRHVAVATRRTPLRTICATSPLPGCNEQRNDAGSLSSAHVRAASSPYRGRCALRPGRTFGARAARAIWMSEARLG